MLEAVAEIGWQRSITAKHMQNGSSDARQDLPNGGADGGAAGGASDPRVLGQVLGLLKNFFGVVGTTDEDRRESLAALRTIGPDAVTVAENILVGYLRSSIPEVCRRVMSTLDKIISPTNPMFNALDEALKSGETSICQDAFAAVLRVGDSAPQAVVTLIDALSRDLGVDESGCLGTAWELGEIGPAAVAAIPLLLKALDHHWYRGEPYEDDFRDNSATAQERQDKVWRASIANAISKIGPVAIPIRVAMLRQGEGFAGFVTIVSQIGAPGVPSLIIALSDKNRRVREAAAEALALIGTDVLSAVPALSAILDNSSEDEEMRRAATKALMGVTTGGVTAAIPALIAALSDANWEVRMYAAKGLWFAASVPPSTMPALIAILSDGETEVRKYAVKAVAKHAAIAIELSVPALIDALSEPDENLRRDVVYHLVKASDAVLPWITSLTDELRNPVSLSRYSAGEVLARLGASGIAVLLDALGDEDSTVRACAVRSLGHHVQGSDEDIVIAALADMLDDKAPQVREAVVEGLSRHPHTAFAALLKAFRKHAVAAYRAELVSQIKQALTRITPWTEASALLVKALDDSMMAMRILAAELLFPKVEACPEPLRILQNALNHQDQDVRVLAAIALGRFGAAAVRPLITSMQDSPPELTQTAAETLGKIGPAAVDATTTLARWLGDRNAEVRQAAADAIVRIGPVSSEFGQRMKDDLVAMHKKLHVFRLIGDVLLAQGDASLSFVKLAKTLSERYREEYSEGTLSNYRDDLSEFFRKYRGEPQIKFDYAERRTTNNDDYFDDRQGRPFRMLRKGWQAWGETKLYFALLEGDLRGLLEPYRPNGAQMPA